MTVYNPNLNPRAHSEAWLTKRANQLRRVLTGGTPQQRQNANAQTELRLINAELHRLATMPTARHRVPTADQVPAGRPVKRNLSRLRLDASPESDVARIEPTQAPVVRSTGTGAYSARFESVRSDYQPRKNSFYA